VIVKVPDHRAVLSSSYRKGNRGQDITCNSSYWGQGGGRMVKVRVDLDQKLVRSFLKTTKAKRTEVLAQVIEHLPSKS
jgi:hypothetical protein